MYLKGTWNKNSQGNPEEQVLLCAKLLQSCATLQPRGLWSPRFPCPWDAPGKNTGVGYPCLLHRLLASETSCKATVFKTTRHWRKDRQIAQISKQPPHRPQHTCTPDLCSRCSSQLKKQLNMGGKQTTIVSTQKKINSK